jgi:hypothetical protein
LETIDLAEKAMSSLLAPLDLDPNAYLCISLDAEWNISRHIGVSVIQIVPHNDPDMIFVIPVSIIQCCGCLQTLTVVHFKIHKFHQLPPSLLRLLISD